VALTKEQLQELIALQVQDSELDKVQAALDGIPVMIAGLKRQIEEGRAQAAAFKAKTMDLEKKKKEKELELAQKEEAAKKHGGELNSVKTNEAFRALQGEIDRAKAEGSEIETQILVLMEEIDVSRKSEKAAAVSAATEQKEFDAEILKHEARLAEKKAEFETAKTARDLAAAPIPAEAMKVYDYVRSRGKLNAIVAIDKTMCSACRISLAPQVIVEATKLKSLVCCESCQRILYRLEALNAPAKAAA
jgi:predicted  nucleic acid-binding Zn-ribbon protein